MAVPKRKQSRSRGRKRRSHDALTPPTVVKCSHCGDPKRPHHVCPSCGTYRERQIIDLENV